MNPKIEQLCAAAVAHHAEDLFLKAGELPHARIGGQIVQLGEEILTEEDLAALWAACAANPNAARDQDASWSAPDGSRFRVNLFKQLGQLGAALRPIKTVIPPLDTLGVPTARLQAWASRTSGILLVTGATGSGKSTTLAALLDWVNQTATKHIVTIEDPVEDPITPSRCLVTQREVGTDTASFVAGLRAALRQSPDVIFLGEIRDAESARIALQAAETGHLVVVTMHSSDVAETMERLVALFPPEEREAALIVLAKQLTGVLCQRLLSSTDGGLHLVVEHLECSGAVRKWVQAGETEKIEEFLEREAGDNVPFVDSILEACAAGRISEEVARAACPDPHSFDRRRSGISSGTS